MLNRHEDHHFKARPTLLSAVRRGTLAHLAPLFLVVAAAVVFAAPQTVLAHAQIQGSALDIVIYRDRVSIRAEITPFEIVAFDNNLSDAGDDPDKQLTSYSQYLVAHLHVLVEGVPLQGRVLSTSCPKDPNQRRVCEMEFRNRTAGAAILPDGATFGMVRIYHNLMADKGDIGEYVSGVTYAVRIAQSGCRPQDGDVLSDDEEVSLTCNFDASAASQGATTQSDQQGPIDLSPRAGLHMPGQEDVMAMLKTGQLSVAIVVAAFLVALIWGAGHALTPGHGKAIAAAYLIGSRSTPRHAIFLGLTVTLTHTVGVFALGLIALFASSFVGPWRLFPWMSTASGLIVAGLGAAMFISRLKALRAKNGHDHHEHDHGHTHDYHDHGHDHGHAHEDHHHDQDYGHMHDDHHHEHDHDHGHSHLPPGADGKPATWRSLLGLGISAGLLPCPSAMVLLLAAVAINRTALGIALVVAFSLGLAATLTTIGLLLVKGRKLIGGIPHGTKALRFLPIASALFILVVGVWLTVVAAMTIRF